MLTLPDSYSNAEKYTNDLCEFVATPLIRQITGGIHVNDAFVHHAWENLPQEWTDWWSSWPDHRLAQQDLIDAIDERVGSEAEKLSSQPPITQSRPQSLTEWLKKLRSLALPRLQREGSVIDLPEALRCRMKTKKINEVSKAVAYIHNVCRRKGISRIIDMGSGQGYLSVSLAYLFPDMNILAIDGSKSQLDGSEAFATSLRIPETRLRHIIHWIDGSSVLGAKIEEWAQGEKCMLVGLHACGSLSEHMLRYFTTLPCIEAIAVIGCCYNHIIPHSPTSPDGFPISSIMRRNNVTLSATALMTACQTPNNWTKPDSERKPDNEKSVFSRRRLYRSILEKVFFDKGIKVDTEGRLAWGIRKGDVISFTKYAHRAMDCLGIDHAGIPDSELLLYEERYKHCEGQIAILWTLSVLCCKVIESTIAMDRYWYLVDQGMEDIDVFPIFDPKISARNLIIVAEKTAPKHEDR